MKMEENERMKKMEENRFFVTNSNTTKFASITLPQQKN